MLMRLETAEITDTTREARTFCKVAGSVPVSFHPVLFQSKIDHRAQKQCGRPRRLSAPTDYDRHSLLNRGTGCAMRSHLDRSRLRCRSRQG
jgi:hypothetical protein